MFHPIERIALAALDRPAKAAEWLRIVDGLHADPGFWWLDSALETERLGRHSFAGSDPYLRLSARVTGGGESLVEIDVQRGVRAGLDRGYHRVEADPIETPARSCHARTPSSTRPGRRAARAPKMA